MSPVGTGRASLVMPGILRDYADATEKAEAMFKKTSRGAVMETKAIQMHAHQKNIDRYKGLLKTRLSETERLFLKKRVCEETIAMLQLMEHQGRSMRSLILPPRASGQ